MRCALIVALCLLTAPAAAAATDWQELSPGVRARLVSSDRLEAGTTLVGLELDMPRDTKTYWRVPGETGFPAEFDLSASRGIADFAVRWPLPQRDRTDGYLDYVYRGAVVLPLQLTLSGEASLVADVTLGVCSDICVPASARFTLALSFQKPDPGQGLRLAQAMAAVPVSWTDEPAPVGRARLDPASGLWLEVDPALDIESLIADLGPQGPQFGAPQKSRDAGLVLFPIRRDVGLEGLIGKVLTITFATPAGAWEVQRRLEKQDISAAGG